MSKSDTIRLTKKQKEIIKLLRGDYILKSQTNFGQSYWLTKISGFAYLKNIDLRKDTFRKLLSLALIKHKRKDKYNHRYYVLSERGKNIKL